MRSSIVCATLLTVAWLAGCDSDPVDPDAGMDAGTDAGAPDAGPPWTGPGCNPVDGIECDGDWDGRCDPGCAASECCSPQRGAFACVARGVDGSCPAANLWVDETQIADGQTATEWRFFEADDCAIAEGCVQAAGWRRLLRFSTWTPNTGDADLFLGVPSDEIPYFQYSECHDHHHFNGYAEYELRTAEGTVAAVGHKQAFCLLDFYQYPGTNGNGAVYDCDNQGIQRDWQDVYDADLDCQWVDVTDVAPGEYTLRIALNTDRALLESNYDDNQADIGVTIPVEAPADITAPCTFARTEAFRDCGWTRDAAYDCTEGDTVTVGCSTACGLGSCAGDTVMRVCEEANEADCRARNELVHNDDSGCDEEDTCSQATFTCPASGRYVVFTAPYDTLDDESSCRVRTMSTPPA